MSVYECLCGVGVGFTVSVWGVQGFGLVIRCPQNRPSRDRPSRDRPSLGRPSPGPPKISLFFFLSHHLFVLFLSFSGCLLVEFWCCFEDRAPQRAHLSAPALQTPPKFHEKTPPEREEKNEFCGGTGKKREILGPPPFGSPLFLGWAPPPFEPPPFEPPPFST